MSEVPFSSERKRMTVVCAGEDGHCMFTKGAPEILAELADSSN